MNIKDKVNNNINKLTDNYFYNEIHEDKLIKDLEELDWLLDNDIKIQGNNLLNINIWYVKKKQKSKSKKNKHKEYKWINKGKKEKILLDTAHERLLKRKKI